MNLVPILPAPAPQILPPHLQSDARLREAAVQLEATFLSEMLKSAGFGESRSAFGGGLGEEQFQSFMRDAQARKLAESGGIGLAQALFEALKVRLDG